MKPSTREHEKTEENHTKDFPVGQPPHQTLSDLSQTHQLPAPSQLPPPELLKEENGSPSKAVSGAPKVPNFVSLMWTRPCRRTKQPYPNMWQQFTPCDSMIVATCIHVCV